MQDADATFVKEAAKTERQKDSDAREKGTRGGMYDHARLKETKMKMEMADRSHIVEAGFLVILAQASS